MLVIKSLKCCPCLEAQNETRQEFESALEMLMSSKCRKHPLALLSWPPKLAGSRYNQHLRQSLRSNSWPCQVSMVYLSTARISCQQGMPHGPNKNHTSCHASPLLPYPSPFTHFIVLSLCFIALEHPLECYSGIKSHHLIQCFPLGRGFLFPELDAGHSRR